MKYLITIILIFLSFTIELRAQSESITDENKSRDILVGKFERADLQKGSFAKYFFDEYNQYEPDKEVLNQVKKGIFTQSVTIVLGTWCHDSKEQVPRFFKILDQIDYNTQLIEIICVDKNKTAGPVDISELNIVKVPTFIFYRDGAETGRIIETPNLTLEKDILSIFQTH